MGVFTEGLLAAAEKTMRKFGADHVADVKASIGTSCPQFHTGKGGHAGKGAPPFTETGRLRASVRTDTVRQGLRVITTVAAGGGVSYARILEDGSHPFMLPAFRRWSPKFKPELITTIPADAGGSYR